MLSSPEVSVVLPTYNRLKYLRQAIDSVRDQTHGDWELIVADDGSDDETRAYLSGLADSRVHPMWLPHSGNPSAVRNRAIRRARGRYIAFLDSDDLWEPRKLEVQLSAMHSRPDRRWSYTNVVLTDATDKPLPSDMDRWGLHEGNIIEPLLNLRVNISTAAVMAERSLIEEVNGFDEEQHFGEDCDLWLRLSLLSEVSVSSEPLARIRDRHSDRYSIDRISEYHGWVRLYGKMAEIVPDARLQSLCRRRRAEVTLFLAGLYFDRRDHVAVARTLVAGTRLSWRYPQWWWGASKAALRSIVPGHVLSMYRAANRVRERRAHRASAEWLASARSTNSASDSTDTTQ
jgi:glycosyltransferase involved in cell wall biosynthesis